MQVLLVEDDPHLQRIVAEGLREEAISVTVAGDFKSGLERLLFARYDVAVLDILLPGGSGLEICSRLREEGDATPILLLTSRDAVRDRVLGLESGADDYLTKPFAFEELVARVRALARRSAALLPSEVTVADLRVDLRSRRIERGGRAVELTNKEWDLLEIFVRNLGAVVERSTLTEYVWDDNHDPASNALEVLMRRLRSKIDDAFDAKLIHTIRGAGYRFGP
jgi:two-component system copper resistance phosphate regulon response regulator CusR